MPAFHVPPHLADAVRDGTVRQVVEADRPQRPVQIGKVAHVYAGVGGPKLGKYVVERVETIGVDELGRITLSTPGDAATIRQLTGAEREAFAVACGHDTAEALVEALRERRPAGQTAGLPFIGEVITWGMPA